MENKEEINKQSNGEILATTRFADDGEVVETISYQHHETDDISTKDSTITAFLSKPINQGNISWGLAATHPRGYQLASWDTMTLLLSTNIWKNKIDGFNLFRGTACVKLTLNASPFQQGKLMLSYLPGYDTISSADPSYSGLHCGPTGNWTTNLAALCSASMQPNVTIDCRDSSAILKMPFVTPYSYYDVKQGGYEPGRFTLYVLSPLLTGAAGEETTVDVTVWQWWEDVELAAPLVLQSSSGKSKRSFTTQLVEKKVGDSGKISEMLGAVGDVSEKLGSIPIIGGYATDLAWVARAASSVASIFGFSKPISEDKPYIVASQIDRYGANCDGIDASIPLALSCTNQTKYSDEMSCRPDDEMSLSFLLGREAITRTIAWTDVTTSGSSVDTFTLAPNGTSCYTTGTIANGGHTATFRIGPPIYYLSNIFKFWRGSIRLRFVFVKTEFHTGRLQITWTPVSATGTAISTLNSVYSLREIVDLKEGNEVCFDFPYMLPFNYALCENYSGKVDIQVINELRHPSTAATSVDILMYVSAGEDFEFQVPTQPLPTVGTMLPLSLQSREVVVGVIGNLPKRKRNYAYPSTSTGESCHSIKQLLMRNNPILQTTAITSANGLLIWPWLAAALTFAGGALSGPNAGGDLYSFLSPMYAYFRGQVRIKAVSTASGITNSYKPIVATVNPKFFDNTVGPIRTSAIWTGPGTQVSNTAWVQTVPSTNLSGSLGHSLTETEGVAYYQVPYYAQTRFSAVLRQTAASDKIPNDLGNAITSQPHSVLAVASLDLFANYYHLERSFPEDFQLGYFIGCPPLYISFV